MIFGIVIGVVLILILVIWFVSTSNFFNTAIVKIDEANSGIDIALTKRYDLLTKSLATVKGYAKHEAETLAKVIEMRNGNISSLSMEEKAELANKMNDAAKQLNVVMEAYPELKADAQFKQLQIQIADCEEHIQAARRIYNANITTFNTKVVSFPSSIVAKMKHLEKKAFFEADAAKREDVKIEF